MVVVGVIKTLIVLGFFVMGYTKREKNEHENSPWANSSAFTNAGWSIGSMFCFPVDAWFLFFCYIITGRLADVELWYLVLSLLLQAILVYGEYGSQEMYFQDRCEKYMEEYRKKCERRKKIEDYTLQEKSRRDLPENASTVLEKEGEYKVVCLADTGEYMVYRNTQSSAKAQ